MTKLVTPEPTRAAQLLRLRLASPMRPAAGGSASTDGLALFDRANAPTLF